MKWFHTYKVVFYTTFMHETICKITAMKTFCHSLLLLLAISPVITAQAADKQTIYKSIDKNGKVTYSATPAQNAEQTTSIKLTPPPSEEDIQAARERQKRSQKAADILDENRKKRDEIIAEENRLKREKQKQLQQQRQAEKNNENKGYVYPYIPGRRPGGILPPAHRPVHLPVR